ncbi:ATP-binding protein [Streptomyces himalayensis]|uniref:ATP-binding protein n=1 Tax=Streptomyces himalayensis subsp. himalayensis TaxID=2756131 RepID=A0A7W0IAJ9_9ACTN|nr:ATP-binding protein [Streptomyces himalayensis]MBA2948512.1 ATP-binding protein [Streptomyces himalayensis subsp. himalayensis]
MLSRPRDEPQTAESDRTAGAARQRTTLFARRDLSARDAREFVAETLTQWGCRERLDDVRLCASELVTNALRHGAPADRLILVRLELHGVELLIEVHDGGKGTPRQREAQDTSDDGRGLFLVSAVADDWGVAARQGPGKRVWASFMLPAETAC